MGVSVDDVRTISEAECRRRRSGEPTGDGRGAKAFLFEAVPCRSIRCFGPFPVLDSHSRGISFSTEITRSRIWTLERNLLIGDHGGWAALKIGDWMLRWVNHYQNLVVRAESAFPARTFRISQIPIAECAAFSAPHPPRVLSLAAFGRRPLAYVAPMSLAGIRNPQQKRKSASPNSIASLTEGFRFSQEARAFEGSQPYGLGGR